MSRRETRVTLADAIAHAAKLFYARESLSTRQAIRAFRRLRLLPLKRVLISN